MTVPWTVEHWIEEPDAESIEYSEYWNDAEAERAKEWDVRTGDFGRVERYLGDVGLESDLRACLAVAEHERGRPLSGTGVDVAAGTLWAVPVLLAAESVKRLWCVEYSRHRLLEIGPLMLEHYRVDPDRVVLAFGSFYELKVPDATLDFAFLSQAFHHADRPDALLGELRRVVAPGGVVMIVGEHRLKAGHYMRYAARAAASLLPSGLRQRVPLDTADVRRTLHPTGADLEPSDPVLGDHSYTDAEYRRLFEGAGFRVLTLPRRRGAVYQSFVLLA